MAASGRATWHVDVSMTSSRGTAGVDVSMVHADVSVDRSTLTGQLVNRLVGPRAHWSASGSHRQVGSACQCREKEKKEKENVLTGRKRRRAPPLLGLLGPDPADLPSFLFLLFSSTADGSGPLVGDSWIPCGTFLIRCELQCACVCCQRIRRSSRLAMPRTRRRGAGVVTMAQQQGGGDGSWCKVGKDSSLGIGTHA